MRRTELGHEMARHNTALGLMGSINAEVYAKASALAQLSGAASALRTLCLQCVDDLRSAARPQLQPLKQALHNLVSAWLRMHNAHVLKTSAPGQGPALQLRAQVLEQTKFEQLACELGHSAVDTVTGNC